jgi:hypothetical protein
VYSVINKLMHAIVDMLWICLFETSSGNVLEIFFRCCGTVILKLWESYFAVVGKYFAVVGLLFCICGKLFCSCGKVILQLWESSFAVVGKFWIMTRVQSYERLCNNIRAKHTK